MNLSNEFMGWIYINFFNFFLIYLKKKKIFNKLNKKSLLRILISIIHILKLHKKGFLEKIAHIYIKKKLEISGVLGAISLL